MQRQRDDVARPTSACRVCRLGSAWIADTRRSSQQRPVRVCPRCVVFSPPVAVTFGPLHVLHHLIVRLSAVFEPFRTREETGADTECDGAVGRRHHVRRHEARAGERAWGRAVRRDSKP